MKKLIFINIFIAFLISAGCSLDGVKIELKEDGSGKASLMEMKYSMSQANLSQAFTGIKNTSQVSMTVNMTELEFPDANKANLGGITMKLTKNETGGNVIVDIPLDPNSPWSSAIHLNTRKYNEKENQEFMEKMKKDSGKEDMMMNSMMQGLEKSLTQLQFEIIVPGRAESSRILFPEGKNEWLKRESENGMPGKENSVTVTIPMKDFAEKKYRKVSAEIKYSLQAKEQEQDAGGIPPADASEDENDDSFEIEESEINY